VGVAIDSTGEGRGGGGHRLDIAADAAMTLGDPRTRIQPPALTLPRKGGGDAKENPRERKPIPAKAQAGFSLAVKKAIVRSQASFAAAAL